MKTGDNIRFRTDGRYEARYKKGRLPNGKIQYGYCYGKTIEEAEEKRDYEINRLNKKNKKELNLLVLGAGAQGLEVLDIANNLRIFSRISLLDDDSQKNNIIGKWSDAKKLVGEYPVAIVAVADKYLRSKWTNMLRGYGYIIPTLIHPTAYIPTGTIIGSGTVISARVTIATGVIIGEGCIITSGSIVPKQTIMADWGYFDFDTYEPDYHEEYRINGL